MHCGDDLRHGVTYAYNMHAAAGVEIPITTGVEEVDSFAVRNGMPFFPDDPMEEVVAVGCLENGRPRSHRLCFPIRAGYLDRSFRFTTPLVADSKFV